MRKRSVTFIVLAALMLPAEGAVAGISSPPDLRGSVNGGVSLQDLRSQSYDAKLLPTIGGFFAVFTMKEKPLNWGIEISYEHNFRSNDKNSYYYSSYERFSFTPLVELSILGRSPRLYALGGIGVNIAFSGYMNKAFMDASLGAGIRFQKSFFHGILVSYTHGFLSDYSAFETFRAGMVFRLGDKEKR
jgi:hypothetical protein